MAKEKIKWHPAFEAAIQLELKEYKEYLEFLIEHQLTDEPLKIDVVIIKKLKEIEINKSLGRIFRKYNIVEYKSPTDYISIDDYYKVKAYAYLYKVLNGKTNEIDADELTITLVMVNRPVKLLKYLENKKLEVVNKESGIYYIEGSDIRTQLLVMKELEDKEAEYIKLLQIQNKSYNLLSKWIEEYQKNNKNSLYAVMMEVIAQSNQNELMEAQQLIIVAG